MEIGLSLGSNIEDRRAFLKEGRRRIRAIPGIQEKGVSAIYETEPVGVPPAYQHLKYLNAVILIESQVPAEELLLLTRQIERDLGRPEVAEQNSPRTLDIDILYAGETVINSTDPDLNVPHPRWAERAFVVRPLADIRPDLVIPGTSQPVSEMAAHLPDLQAIRLFSLNW